MTTERISFRRTRFAALVLLTGGTLFSTCTSRLKDATVDGATNFLFALLDPATIAGSFLPDQIVPSNGV